MRTCSEGQEGHECDGVRAQSPIERAWRWVVEVCHFSMLLLLLGSISSALGDLLGSGFV